MLGTQPAAGVNAPYGYKYRAAVFGTTETSFNKDLSGDQCAFAAPLSSSMVWFPNDR